MQDVEFAILDWIGANLSCPVLDSILPIFTRLCDHGELWILLAVLLILRPGSRKKGTTLAVALLLDLLVCNVTIKPLVGRIRPFAVRPRALLVPAPLDGSFPSGHTAVSFTAAFALRRAGSPLWIPALLIAVLMAFSRLYLFVHWPSDVLAGAALGILLGELGGSLAERFWERISKTIHKDR